ncbi:MAG: FtsX-like permease family protein, partial [Acidobacteriota bacterium]
SLEVALTLAIAVNCVNLILDLRKTMTQPSGMDEEHILALTVRPHGEAFRDADFARAVRESDLELLEKLPGVRAAIQTQNVPLSGGGSASGRRPLGAEGSSFATPYFRVTRSALETFGVELLAGRDFTEADYRDEPNRLNVIVSKAMADLLFPDGDALGKQISDGREQDINTIIGITDHMLNSWPDTNIADRVMLMPIADERREYTYYLVRAEPGELDRLYLSVESALLAANPGRVVDVATLSEVRADNFRISRAVIQLLSGVIGLLMLVTALGIVGLTSFSVTQRIRHIGVRRALGATRGAILRYFLAENWLITTLGIVFGIGLAYLLNYGLMTYANGVRLGWPLLAGGAVFLWTVGLLAALAPALRGTRVAPVVATRSV